MTATVMDLMADMAEWSRDRSVDPCARWACVSDRLNARMGLFRTVCGLYAALDRWAARWGQYAYPGVKHYGRNES